MAEGGVWWGLEDEVRKGAEIVLEGGSRLGNVVLMGEDDTGDGDQSAPVLLGDCSNVATHYFSSEMRRRT